MQHHGTHIRMAGCVERGAPSRGGRLRWLAASAAALFLLLQLSSAGKAAHTSKPTSSIRSYHIRPSAWPKPAERRVDCPAVPGEKASALALALKSGRYMNFTSTLDQYYIQQFSALLNSLAINNPGKAILIHVLAGGLTNKQACAWRQAMIAYRPSLHIFLYNITREVNELYSGIVLPQRIRPVFMSRLLAPVLLPEVKKVIILDGDIVVNAPLQRLWETDLSNSCGVAGRPFKHHDSQVTSWLELAHVPPSAVGVDPQAAVLSINGGVLVLDLDNLRKNDFVGYAHSMVNKFKVIEQVVFNCYCLQHGGAVPLDSIWNGISTMDDFATRRFAIYHFSGSDRKPWKEGLVPAFGVNAHEKRALQLYLKFKIPSGVLPQEALVA